MCLGSYQFIVAKDTFTIEVWGENKETGKSTQALWVGNIKRVPEPLPWYRKYLTPMMIGLIIVNLLGKGFMKGA